MIKTRRNTSGQIASKTPFHWSEVKKPPSTLLTLTTSLHPKKKENSAPAWPVQKLRLQTRCSRPAWQGGGGGGGGAVSEAINSGGNLFKFETVINCDVTLVVQGR